MNIYKVIVEGKTMLVPAESILDIITFAQRDGISIKAIKANSEQAERSVVVTCGRGNATHKWETTKSQAIRHKNTCPDHRKEA
jgi:L-rhamnose isomerase